MDHLKKYAQNCFFLLLPVLLWNIFLTSKLPLSYSPETYWDSIPPFIFVTEHVLRIAVFSLPVFMIMSAERQSYKKGFWLYGCGLILYFSSWILQIFWPESTWSRSIIGYTAPAFTSIIWMLGIGLVGKSIFRKFKGFVPIYKVIAILFVFVHTTHAILVYNRLLG